MLQKLVFVRSRGSGSTQQLVIRNRLGPCVYWDQGDLRPKPLIKVIQWHDRCLHCASLATKEELFLSLNPKEDFPPLHHHD